MRYTKKILLKYHTQPMQKSNLYTKTGDQGTTSLVGGERVRKDSVRLDAYGTLDEFSAHLGVLHARPDVPEICKRQLLTIQNMMFNFGAYLATRPEPDTTPRVSGLSPVDLDAVERWIDSLDSETPRIHAFVLPGGSESAAFAHVARTVCRRAEREILRLSQEEYVDPMLLSYINRLSDYLFILARHLNHVSGVAEITWKLP